MVRGLFIKNSQARLLRRKSGPTVQEKNKKDTFVTYRKAESQSNLRRIYIESTSNLRRSYIESTPARHRPCFDAVKEYAALQP